MKRSEVDWKARQIHGVWRRVQSRICLDTNQRFSQLREADQSWFRNLAQSGVPAIDKAWACEEKRRVKSRLSYRSPYKESGLHPSKSLRGR